MNYVAKDLKLKRKAIPENIVMNVVQLFIKTTKNHPTAEEIYLELNETNSNISRGTIYRNLNLLVEKGIIKRISISNLVIINVWER